MLIHDFSTTSRRPTRNVKRCQSDQAEPDCQPNFSFLRLSSSLATSHRPLSHLPLLLTGKQLHDLWTSHGSSPRHWSAIHAFTTVRPCTRQQSSRGASWKAGSDRQKGYRRHPRPAAFSPDPLSPAFPLAYHHHHSAGKDVVRTQQSTYHPHSHRSLAHSKFSFISSTTWIGTEPYELPVLQSTYYWTP